MGDGITESADTENTGRGTMTEKQKKAIMLRENGQICCQGCGEIIHPETDNLDEVEYVKTKRGSNWFFHTQCAGNVWSRKISWEK